jgi:hypothetical protein
MNKEFIPYEQALALKELKFDEPCFVYIYIGDTGNNVDHIIEIKPSLAKNHNLDSLCISKPTFSQAFRWFREKYNLDGYMSIDVWNKKTTTYSITGGIEGVIEATSYGDLYDIDSKDYDTYEEAELECLKKLIKIVKEKK